MIIDTIDQLAHYSSLKHAFQPVAEHIAQLDLKTIQPGKYAFDDTEAFYYCFEYETKEASYCKGEIHTKMIDVHFIIDGCEVIGMCPRHAADLTPYDAENDYSAAAAVFDHYTLSAGAFAVFFPHEAHVTAISPSANSTKVKKLVFKLPAA